MKKYSYDEEELANAETRITKNLIDKCGRV